VITGAESNLGTLFVNQYYSGLEYAVSIVAVVILISSLDDLFVDSWYWIREIIRALTVNREHRPLTNAQLHEKEEQYIAIMVPAWKEDDVIASMIEDAVRTLDYRNYMIFVGTYQNDPATNNCGASKCRMTARPAKRIA